MNVAFEAESAVRGRDRAHLRPRADRETARARGARIEFLRATGEVSPKDAVLAVIDRELARLRGSP